ncbi:MAG: hypothetical protein EOO50_15525 [Flavobacterium sp.]|uniref:hypothetical protein n=1 Tax=Flavobacterium sp. TaxID=239 RepID=UPI0011FAF511|nr:hypothetical protein [Flavobacterium sp.]RZJ64434.1 MAG: hypothetical protein EOO50_15525 [Flavobacterium sp.]
MKTKAWNFLLLAFATILFSCNNDDTARRPRVVYQVMASSDIISTIDFKGFNGEQAVVAQQAAAPGWSQYVLVNLPFTAVLNTNLSNTGDAAATYELRITVNDSVAGQKTGTLEPGMSLTESLSADAFH